MEKKLMNPSVKAVLVLVCIAVVCVALLAVLNDLLYVAPDFSVFSRTVEGEYSQIEVSDVPTKGGTVTLAVEGTTSDGANAIGLYVTGVKSGMAGPFELVVMIDKDNGTVLGASEIVDGSTGGYSWNEEKLSTMVGAVITSPDSFDNVTTLLETGVTNSSNGVLAIFMAVAQYYCAVYM